MYRPHRPDGGIEIIGAISIDPPLSLDDVDRLIAINMVSTDAALDERPSAVVDDLAPGHPAGPSSWIACEHGCCLEIAQHSIGRPNAFKPWLDYLTRGLLPDHLFSGAVIVHDCAEGTFTSLGVDGGRVKSKRVASHQLPGPQRRDNRSGSARLRGV